MRIISLEKPRPMSHWLARYEKSKAGSTGSGGGRTPMRGRYEWENYAQGSATFSFCDDFVAPFRVFLEAS